MKDGGNRHALKNLASSAEQRPKTVLDGIEALFKTDEELLGDQSWTSLLTALHDLKSALLEPCKRLISKAVACPTSVE